MSSVFKKIALVMSEIGTLPKDAKHDQGYAYQSIQAVSARLNNIMSKHGLLCLQSVSGWQIVDGRYVVEYDMMLVDADTGDSIHRSWASEAMIAIRRRDGSEVPDDKALGKAHSYALKYFLIRTFIISAQDDPDGDETDHYPTPRIQQPITNAKASAPVDRGNLPVVKSPLVPSPKMEDHFEDGDYATTEIEAYSEPIEKVVIKTTNKGKTYFVLAGCSIWDTGIFEKLGYDEYTLNQMTKPGSVMLPDPVRVAYIPEGKDRKYPEALRVFRPVNNVKVVLKEQNAA
jgi:energy-converting hydrogenase Eha subunit F